jgi:hypothetical protein
MVLLKTMQDYWIFHAFFLNGFETSSKNENGTYELR